MSYEISKFGDGGYSLTTTNVVRNVSNHYGPRDTGGATGVIGTKGAIYEMALHLNAETLREQAWVLTTIPFLPALSRIEDVFLEVETPFTLTGTTPGVSVGTEGTEATNGIDITEAQLETAGVYDLTSTLAGTWAAAGGLTVKTDVGIALTGGTPAVTGKIGEAKLVIRYIKV